VLDLGLAIVHHILVFSLVALLAMEGVMLGGASVEPARLGRLDAGYGLTAVLAVAVGFGRAVWGGKGWAFYESNPFFWGKIAAFVVLGLISIGPTVAFIRWRRAAAGLLTLTPPSAELKRVRTWVGLEALLLVPILGCAAAMARYPF